MLSKYGQAVRKHRIDRGLRLNDMAIALGYKASFLSAIETGQKPVPQGDFISRVAAYLELSETEHQELHRAALEAAKIVKLPVDEQNRDFVAAFARSLPNLSAEQQSAIEAILKGEK